MSYQDSDTQLGSRFAQLLESRRPVQLPKALILLQDLMGADVSLLPSLRLLASQPVFLKFLNSQPSSVLLAQRDTLISSARETLAPPLVTRVTSFLDGYLGRPTQPPKEPDPLRASPAPERLVSAATAVPSFPSVLSPAGANLPATVIAETGDEYSLQLREPATLPDTSARPNAVLSAAPKKVPIENTILSHLSNTMAKVLVEWLLIGLMSAVGLGALFRLPMVCEVFDLCRKPNKQVEQPQKENKKLGPISLPKTNSKASQATVTRSPLPPRQPTALDWKPKPTAAPPAESAEPPAAPPAESTEPLHPDRLW
jgi:hypothetical protein